MIGQKYWMISPGLVALILSFIAGLGTAIGGALSISFVSFQSDAIIGQLEGFSAGVMLFISVLDIIPESLQHLSFIETFLFVIIGMILMKGVESLFPDSLIQSMSVAYASKDIHSHLGSEDEELGVMNATSPADTRRKEMIKAGWVHI